MSIGSLNQPSILILITDQQRYPQHWPSNWVQQNLPTLQRLMDNGLTFTNAFSAACECSPSRAAMTSSNFYPVNGISVTFPLGEQLKPASGLTNLITMLGAAGYQVAWKGKWHLSHPKNGSYSGWTAQDIDYLAQQYGVPNWNPPDAGTSMSPDSTIGGGTANNDGRFIGVPPTQGQTPGFGTSALDFLSAYNPAQGPFCLVVSLVNPHDVYLYPGLPNLQQPWLQQAGYPFMTPPNVGIELPPNQCDSLESKPSVQLAYRKNYDSQYPLPTTAEQTSYVNFYAWLHTQSDALMGQLLAALDDRDLTDSTLIVRFCDHGEMGLSHGLREKMYSAYDEAIHVPLIFSNPTLFSGQTTAAMASLIDVLPTLATIGNATLPSTALGTDLTPVLEDPTQSPQDYVVYAYDDQGGLGANASGHIRCLRMPDAMLGVYFAQDHNGGTSGYEYEMYDLTTDPGELTNLATSANTSEVQSMYDTLTTALQQYGIVPSGWPANVTL